MRIALLGEDILNQKATKVSLSDIQSNSFQDFVEKLMQTMLDAKGIGIAAPQVFDPRAVMIIASRPNIRYPDAPQMEPLVLINPSIEAVSPHQTKDWEGCLSVPGLRGFIVRPDWVDVTYFGIDGYPNKQRFEGFVARIFQHEYDHLIGKTWLDHVKSPEDMMANEVWINRFG